MRVVRCRAKWALFQLRERPSKDFMCGKWLACFARPFPLAQPPQLRLGLILYSIFRTPFEFICPRATCPYLLVAHSADCASRGSRRAARAVTTSGDSAQHCLNA